MARCQRGSACDCTILCRPTVAAAVAAVADVPRSGGAAELVVKPAVLSSCTTPAAPVSTTGSKCAKRLGRPNDRGSWTDVGGTGIDGADGGAAVSDVDHRRWERGRKRRKSTRAAIPNEVDVSKRGGSGESKEQQLLKPNRKIHDHSLRILICNYNCNYRPAPQYAIRKGEKDG